MARVILALLCFVSPAVAQDVPPLACEGNPGWSLTLSDEAAVFRFGGVTQEMTIADRVDSLVPSGPQALTLIGQENTAIVILRRRDCATGPYEIDVLTQRGQSPIILPGCCTEEAR